MSELSRSEGTFRTWRIRSSEPSPVEVRSQKRELLSEQQEDWVADRAAPPEHYLERWPTDPKVDPDAASLLVAEIFQRRDRGEEPSLDDYAKRFPEHGRVLGALVRHQDLIRSLGGKGPAHDRLLRLPAEGDELFGFHLRHQLGRG